MVTALELRAFGFTEDLVDRIMRFLDTSATDLDGSKPDAVGGTSFGTSPGGADCATHAGKARQHVVEAINDMVAGLHGYHSSLDGMRRRAREVDDTSDSDIRRIIVRAEACSAAPTVAAPSQCSLLPRRREVGRTHDPRTGAAAAAPTTSTPPTRRRCGPPSVQWTAPARPC